jgi:hypothetical protein
MVQLPIRFHDDGRKVTFHFGAVLVSCPRCTHAAPRRFQCFACGHSSRCGKSSPNSRPNGPVIDPYFGLPLWLQINTRHGILYAYNAEHLEWLCLFVEARLRERRADEWGWTNSMAARLPRWVKLAKNRDEVLRSLGRLRRRLAAANPVTAARKNGNSPNGHSVPEHLHR